MAGQYRTSTDLITEALANLGVLAAGQSIDPEDMNYVSEKLDAIVRMLAGLDIVWIADVNNIPGMFFAPLADIVAGECATKFGATPDDVIKLKNAGLGAAPPLGAGVGSGAAAMALKQILRGRPTGEVVSSEFF
jgi:hypothetical protein